MRVLVTRPREQGEATAARLAALGHAAVLAPVLVIAPTGDPPPAGDFAALLVTSAHAVPALARVRGDLAGSPVFTVGRRTAAVASASGLAHVVEGDGDGRDLADLIIRTVPAGSRLLHAAGRDRKTEPERTLTGAGFALRVWETYEARPVDRLPVEAAEALRTGAIDAALHYSARSAHQLATLARAAGLERRLAALWQLCLSADVASALDPLRPERVLVAPRPDEASLLGCLDAITSAINGSRPPQSG